MVKKGFKQSIEHRKKIGLFKKGKSYEEIYGIEKAKEIKLKLSFSHKGKIPSKKNIQKRRNSMLKIMNQERKNNISNKLKGHSVSIETRNKISLSNKNNPLLLGKGTRHKQAAKDKIRLANIGKKHSVKTIDKIKAARKKQILPVKDTSIEVKIQNFLKKLGIEYFTHQYMKIEHGYQCDVLIPSINLVIECDGDYWHKYPIGNDVDHIRTSELLEKGFKVLRLWECEINEMGLVEFKERLNL